MAYDGERKPGTGVLYSQKVQEGTKNPDWKGEFKLIEDVKAGEIFKIVAWTKQSGKGPLISIKQDIWKPDPNYRANKNPIPSKPLDDDSEIPF